MSADARRGTMMIQLVRKRSLPVLLLTLLPLTSGFTDFPGGRDAAATYTPQTQKPVRESTFHVESIRRFTLDDLWSQSDLVVEGVVESVGRAPAPANARVNTLKTDYVFQLVTVFKPHSSLQSSARSITVRRFGGTVDQGSYIENHVQEGFPPFSVGQRYILFLIQNALKDPTHYIMLTEQGDAALLVTGSHVTSPGRGPGAKSLTELPYPSVVALLRQRGRS